MAEEVAAEIIETHNLPANGFLRFVEMDIKNAFGMTGTLEFKTNLVILYGYNRQGKTNPIRLLKDLFAGYKCPKGLQGIIDFNEFLDNKSEGHIQLIFEWQGRLYKLRREVKAPDKEYLRFWEANVTAENFKKLPPARKVALWKKAKVLINGEVKTRGANKNLADLENEMRRLKLYPEIIQRLIAIENIQEFKNAMQDLAGGGGSVDGFAMVKSLITKELQEREASIKDFADTTNYLEGKLESFSTEIQQLLEQKRSAIRTSIDKMKPEFQIKQHQENCARIQEFIDEIPLDRTFPQIYKQIKSELVELDSTTNALITKAEESRQYVGAFRERMVTIQDIQNRLELADIEEIIENTKKDIDKVKKFNADFLRMKSNIEEVNSVPEVDEISTDFSWCFDQEVIKILERHNLAMDFKDEYKQIPSQITDIRRDLLDALKDFAKMNEIRKKFNISNVADLQSLILNRQNQLTRVKNPPELNPLEMVPIYGKVEENSISHQQILQLYMDVSTLTTYIGQTNPTSFGGFLLPYIQPGSEAAGDLTALEELIKVQISELNDLESLLQSQSELKAGLEKNATMLEDCCKLLDSLEKTVDGWTNEIYAGKSRDRDFIVKEIGIKPKKEQIAFPWIKEQLPILTNQMIDEVSGKFGDILSTESSFSTLDEAADAFEKDLQTFESDNKNVRIAIDTFNGWLSTEFQWFNDNCKRFPLSKQLKDIIFPTMNIIGAQILSNINLEDAERKIIDKIVQYAQFYYTSITTEKYLKIEKEYDEDQIYLKVKITKIGESGQAEDIPLSKKGPSKSEQAAVSLGVMVALAEFFNGIVVIDEVTDSFDYPSKQRFFKALKEVAAKLTTMIVLKVDVDEENHEKEFSKIRAMFPDVTIYQPVKDEGEKSMRLKPIFSFADIETQGE